MDADNKFEGTIISYTQMLLSVEEPSYSQVCGPWHPRDQNYTEMLCVLVMRYEVYWGYHSQAESYRQAVCKRHYTTPYRQAGFEGYWGTNPRPKYR
jgi:hypothetical protein